MPAISSSLAGIIGEVGSATVEAAAFAGGLAVSPVLKPALQEIENEVWKEAVALGVVRPLDVVLAASIAAEDVAKYDTMQTEASLTGYGPERFADLYNLSLTAPGEGTLIQLLRRSAEVPIDFRHGLRKLRLEEQWDAALGNLAQEKLTPAQLALGIVRSVIDDPGLQVGANDTAGGVVPAFPVSPIDTLQEAGFGGIDKERLRVMVGEIGLPMSLQQAASAYFRKIIELPDFYKAVAQGDTRPAWGPFILEQARQIPTAHDGIEYRLRGWTDDQGMYAQTARHGMSPEDTDLLFKVMGRPMTHRNVFLAQRRGGVYDGPTGDIDPHFLKSLQESNERPEWYALEWAMRFSQPSVFVIRQYLKDGGDPAWARQKLFFEGWAEADIDIFVQEYAPKAAAAKADPWVTKADTQLWTATHKAYKGGGIDAVKAGGAFDLIGIPADTQAAVLARWDYEKGL